MLFTSIKILFVSSIIVFSSWLSAKKPELAGFITALPLVSIIAIALAYVQNHDVENTSKYARSIIFAVPISWLFFVPFFFIDKIPYGFWGAWVLGLVLLFCGYLIHTAITR
jgi:hypothetical protein